jgi:hypothetical protein
MLGLSLISILLSGLLLFYTPTAGAFGGSHADCIGRPPVNCSGYKCKATENVGCSCTDENGKVIEQKSCDSPSADASFSKVEESVN